MRALAPFALILAIGVVAGCNTPRDHLVRSQRAFELNEHDRALALLRDLEGDMPRLSEPEQAHYAYLRGMTDYRIGHRNDARHWLAIARAYDENSPGLLPADWKARTTEALTALDAVVYDEGYAGLAVRTTSDERGEGAEPDDPRGSGKSDKTKPRPKRRGDAGAAESESQ